MFAKLFPQKAAPQHNVLHGNMTPADLNLQVSVHYGIPYTASIMAFDPIQCLLAIGTLDGRIKVIGGENIEGLLIAPKKLPYKFMEFLCNQGFLVGVSNENDIQVWDLENRCLTCSLQWESNVTAFSIIQGTYLMYSGDENGLVSVLKFDAENGKILHLPYHIPAKAVKEAASISFSNHTSVVGILQQPCTSGNRVLIAYEDGVMILWDVSENHIVTIRGHTHLKGDESADSSNRVGKEFEGTSDSEQEEKEICSLCWVSTTILAVGYIDGDILLWNLSSETHLKDQHAGASSNKVVKLQLSSGARRLPVIILHWSADGQLDNNHGGQLFVYGGDEMGSEEVLTVLSLAWSSGIETVKCVARVDLALHGSFADMILIPKTGAIGNAPAAAVFILTNPGQLHVYDVSLLSDSRSRDTKPAIQANKFPVAIPTADPCMTVAKLCLLPVEGDSCKILLKKASGKRMGALLMGMKWPLTGGIPSELSFSKDFGSGIIYIAGYQDGSIRIWDATHPTFTLIHVIEGEVNGMQLAGGISSISALDFSSAHVSLAVGSESGLVCLYKLCESGSTDNQTVHLVTETNPEVLTVHHKNDFHCTSVFSVSNSAVKTLQFAKSGDKLAVGFQSGRVMMLDTSSISVLYIVDHLSVMGSPIISLGMRVVPHMSGLINSPKHLSPRNMSDLTDVLFVLARNAHITIVDSTTGNIVNPQSVHPKKESSAIAMYVIDGTAISEIAGQKHHQEDAVESESRQSNYPSGESEADPPSSIDSLYPGEVSLDSVLLLCCEDALRLYSLKSVIQGDSTSIHKVNLSNPCCWSTIVKSKFGKSCGLLLLYKTGALEIRSLPDLEVIEENSLMSIIRWNFKTNMDKTMCSSDNGHIALVNGSELGLISTLACINDFRIPESLPSLHDKVLAAAADAARSLSMLQKKKQGPSPRIISGLIKGFKGGKTEHSVDASEGGPGYNSVQQLESYFSRDPFSDASTTFLHDQEVELSIDDIDIDEDLPTASTSSHIEKHGRKSVEDMEREKLFQGAKADVKPRVRTPEEILTQYKFSGDASAAAAHARDKLAQRQEKLQKVRERTEELQHGAENFASMANELVRTMEAKKWWKL